MSAEHITRLRQARDDHEHVTWLARERYTERIAEIDRAIPESPGDAAGRAARILARKQAEQMRDDSLQLADDTFRLACKATWLGQAERRQS